MMRDLALKNKTKNLYYALFGGGINMDAGILSCLDSFSESIAVEATFNEILPFRSRAV